MTTTTRTTPTTTRRPTTLIIARAIWTHLVFGAISFQFGLLLGGQQQQQQQQQQQSLASTPCSLDDDIRTVTACRQLLWDKDMPAPDEDNVQSGRRSAPQQRQSGPAQDLQPQEDKRRRSTTTTTTTTREQRPPNNDNILFAGTGLGDLFAGMTRVRRDDFIRQFDIGVPWEPSQPGNQEVLLLHSSKSSLPNRDSAGQTATTTVSAANATSNCKILKVILTEPQGMLQPLSEPNQCIALVGQYESYHVYKWVRFHNGKRRNKDRVWSPAMQHASRGHQTDRSARSLPGKDASQVYFKALSSYLLKLDDTLARLAPIASKVAAAGGSGGGGSGTDQRQTAVVAVVCNMGHAEMLFNFHCSAAAREISLSKILVFATDTAAAELAALLGFAVFDVRDAFGGAIPAAAAEKFGDATFKSVVMSKFYAVHLLNTLGYDVLLQDADVLWYRDPLEFFARPEHRRQDIMFQDDGARAWLYGPFFANTGFFYARHNPRTQRFFSFLIRMGDMVQVTQDQDAMAVLLSEQVSVHGLRVKILGRDENMGQSFPGGFHYRRRPQLMRKIIDHKMGSIVKNDGNNQTVPGGMPYVFHMSWTTNKLDKKRFFQQMGDWFLREECDEKRVDQLPDGTTPATVASRCCTKKPQISCHYRDLPSIVPCQDSPAIFENRTSFW